MALRQRLRNTRTITIDTKGGDFSTIAAACDYINSQTHDTENRWLIIAYTNDYDAEVFTLPSYTTLKYEGATGTDGEAVGLHIETSGAIAGKFLSGTNKAAFFGRQGSGTATTVEIDRQLSGTSNLDGDLLKINDHPTTSGTIAGALLRATSSGGGVTSGDKFVVERNGDVKVAKNLIVTAPTVPSTASSTGIVGQVAWDSGFVYICTATNTWKRVAIATW